MAYIYATDYGVTFDGSTDDYANLQSAVDAAEGNTLVLSEGTAMLSQNLVIPSNITIKGQFGATFLKPTNGNTSVPCIAYVDTEENVRFEGVGFDGNLANIASFPDTVTVEDSIQVVFKECYWKNTKGIGAYFIDCAESGVRFSKFKDCGIYQLTSSNSADRRQGIAFTNGGLAVGGYDNFATHNTFDNVGLDFISIGKGAGLGEAAFDVSHNRIVTGYSGSIYISGARSFRCVANSVSNGASGGNGIDINVSNNGVVANNVCIGNGAAGIMISDGKKITVSANVCKNNWAGESSTHQGGITLHAVGTGGRKTEDITIVGNYCDDDRGNSSTTQLYGVQIIGDWDNFTRVKVDNSNHLVGRTAAGVKDESNALSNPNAINATEFPQVFTLGHLETKYLLDDHVRGQLMITNITSNYNYISQARPGQAPGQIVDPDSHFASTDTGSGTAVYRGGTTNTVIKNRTGAAKTYMVYVNAVVDTA